MDATQDISQVVKELSTFAQVKIEDDKSQVSVIGKNIANINGLLPSIVNALKDYRVYMISQGATDVNISFVVDRSKLDEVVTNLHKYLFEK
jgi:aspartate kinase